MWQMYNKLGLSVYVSTFDTQMDMLEKLKGSGYYVFTSFHIQEEFNDSYVMKAKEMCQRLKELGFLIIGDVSPKTLKMFEQPSILDFAKEMNLDILRLDYGFEENEILEIAKTYPISFNASTEDVSLAEKILESGRSVFALHNFYPRPETGLDDNYFTHINNRLKEAGIKVLSFIPGDEVKRASIYEGLPTLEKHRKIPPYIAYLDLTVNFKVDGIFVGDIKISETQSNLIASYIKDKVISIPVDFTLEYHYLYDKIFTIRVDSPQTIMRLQESREYSCDGEKQKPYNCIERAVGSITMDNLEYGRYSGEIQVVRNPLPRDKRVNIIGTIKGEYLKIMECVKNGEKIRFVR